jgi:hypothetical protein
MSILVNMGVLDRMSRQRYSTNKYVTHTGTSRLGAKSILKTREDNSNIMLMAKWCRESAGEAISTYTAGVDLFPQMLHVDRAVYDLHFAKFVWNHVPLIAHL